MNKDIRVLILAGGIGRRFWPLTGSKSLFSFAGEPLLLTHLRRLSAAGFSKFTIVSGIRDKDALAQLAIPDVSIDVVVQEKPLGMGDAVLRAAKAIGGSPCLVVNAHDAIDETLYPVLFQNVSTGKAFILGKKVESYFDGGYITLDGDRLSGIVEKPGVGHEPGNLINLVFHFFPDFSQFVKIVEQTTSASDDVYELALAAYSKKYVMAVVPYEGIWMPLKYPWHVLDILAWRLSQLSPSQGKNVQIGKNVIIEGAVVLEDDVQVRENSKIIGPAFIGRGTIIGNNNIIRESQIGEGCVTGFNTDITRSWIGNECWFHNNYIGDSVLAPNVSLGAGTKLANLRLDEGEIFSTVSGVRMNTGRTKLGVVVGTNVRMGINASIMPGVKVGAGSFVGAGVVLDRDLEDGMFCYAKPGYEIKPNGKKTPPEGRGKFKTKI